MRIGEPEALRKAVAQLSRLAGVGPSLARRIVFHLIRRTPDENQALIDSLTHVLETVQTCPVCGALAESSGCPICGDPVHTWQRFCASCGVQVSGALPQLRLQGASADLALRVPPSYWQRGRIERVTFVDDAGPPGSGIIISVLAGDRAEYAYVARTETGALDGPALVGAPIQVFLHARQGEAPVLTALGPDPPDRVAEAIRLWQHWLSS